MKARQATKGAPSADLLVCFPSRANLTLLPKHICSPARSAEASKHHRNHRYNHQYHPHLKKFSNRGGGCQASPLLWAKNKQMGLEIVEPTSPKVTCAGQIKMRHKAAACKSWQSVMKEIERIHNRKHKKRSSWMDSLAFKKDIMQFLTCLRNIRLDFRCLGSIPRSDIATDDDEEGEKYENHGGAGASDANETSRTIFSKWFMVLQENKENAICKEKRKEKEKSCSDESPVTTSVPPPNALLLMRCRSAPEKSWLEEKVERQEEEEEDNDDEEGAEEQEEDVKTEENEGKILKASMEEEKRNAKKESLEMLRKDTEFYKISSDIAKETWIVGGMTDPLSKSRSWKR